MTQEMDMTIGQARTLAEVCEGYRCGHEINMLMSNQGLLYATIYNIVYVIDRRGHSIARRKSDGSRIQHASRQPRSAHA